MQQKYAQTIEILPLHPGLEALDDGFFMVDADWRVTYWNAAAERVFRVQRDDVLGRELWEALPSLRDSTSATALRRVSEEQVAQRYIDLLPHCSPVFLSIHAAPIAGGGLAVHFRDASPDVKQEEQYAALLETIQDGFVAVDANWRIVYMNSVAESLLRLRREKARNLPLWSFLPGAPPEIGECLRSTMADGLKRHLSGVRPEGRIFRGRVYDLWTYPLAGGGISILFEDVSERVAREEELERLAKEAREANHAKSRFFAAISHELRTPLNAIVGYTHLLETGTYGELPEGARRAADRAAVCAEHLARLIDDLLLLTASEVSQLNMEVAPVNLAALIELATEPYRLQAEAKGLRFVCQLPEVVPEIETDRERLRQVITSLLANAVKFTHRGEVRIELTVGEEQVEIAVADTGPGIPPEDRERIFDMFEQLGDTARSNPLIHGSGLGLTVCRQLALLLQGSLTLDETSPRGSRFTLRLPILRCPSA